MGVSRTYTPSWPTSPAHWRCPPLAPPHSTPLAHTRQPGGAAESRENSHTSARPRTHSKEAGNPPSQATTRATPTGPTESTPRDHLPSPTTPSQKKLTTTATQRPTSQKKKTARTRSHRPPPGKRQATYHGDADTTRMGGAGTKGTTAGTGYSDHQWTAKGKNREPHPQNPLPPAGEGSARGRPVSNNHNTRKKRGGGGHRPRRLPHNPPPQTVPPLRERQGRATTKIEEGQPERTGLAAGTAGGPPAQHATATHPNQGNASRRQGGARPAQEKRGTIEAPTHTHHSQTRPRRGRLRRNLYPGTSRDTEPRKAGRERRPSPQTHHQPCSQRPNTRPPAEPAGPGQGWRRADGNPNPSTYQTRVPSQEKPGGDGPQTKQRAPRNSRKPSVQCPDTEAARVMQVTQTSEVRRPGIRLHPEASAALGLEAELAAPKHLGTQVPRARHRHPLGMRYARQSDESLGFRPKEGTCASTGEHPPGATSRSRLRRLALPL